MPRPLGPATEKQREALRWLVAFIDREGCAPTVRELVAGLGFSSTNHGNDVLKALERRELVFRPHDKRARKLRVTAAGRELLAGEPTAASDCTRSSR